MSTVEKSIRLYAWKPNYLTFRIVEGEANSRVLNIQLFDATVPINLERCLVLLFAVKPDSTNSYIDCTIVDAEAGLIEVTLTDQIAAVDGIVDCWIEVIGNSGTSLRFAGMNIEVSNCDMSRKVESADEYPGLVEAMSRANEAANLVTDFAESEIARSVFESFDYSKKYVVENKVSWNGSSYVCIKNTTAGIVPTNTKYWLLVAERGSSGVYVGAGTMPSYCNVQIDPSGDEVIIPEVLQETGDSEEDTMSQKAIGELFKYLEMSDVRIASGGYTGWGEKSLTLDFDFPVDLFIILEITHTPSIGYVVQYSNIFPMTSIRRAVEVFSLSSDTFFRADYNDSAVLARSDNGGKTLIFKKYEAVSFGLNKDGAKYFYIAIGGNYHANN